MLQQVTGSLPAARALPHEEALLLLAHLEHRQTVAALSENVANLRGTQPPRAANPSEDDIKRLAEWEDDWYRANLALIREDCCFHLPLDHEFGEQLNPPPVEHWDECPWIEADCAQEVIDRRG